jgi:hypothetical protein
MEIIFFIIIFGAGLVSGMYITSQIEKSIDKHIDKHIDTNTKKKKTTKNNDRTSSNPFWNGIYGINTSMFNMDNIKLHIRNTFTKKQNRRTL